MEKGNTGSLGQSTLYIHPLTENSSLETSVQQARGKVTFSSRCSTYMAVIKSNHRKHVQYMSTELTSFAMYKNSGTLESLHHSRKLILLLKSDQINM